MSERSNERIVVVVASLDRADELSRWVEHVGRQTIQPVEMIWAVTSDKDLPSVIPIGTGSLLHVVRSSIGSAAQRNAALDAIRCSPTIVAFFDDDYVPTSTCLEDIAKAFRAFPDVVGLTGTLLADGIHGPGIEYSQAHRLVLEREAHASEAREPLRFELWEGLYGCNMAFRAEHIGDVRFDERMPLYGWQEDLDFAARVAKGRRIGRTNAFHGVHQGVKRGRTSGRRFGYSQMVNPAYLYRKGSMSRQKMLQLSVKNFMANHIRSLRPEPWVDRRGRLVGNWLGLADLIRGRIEPERVLTL